MALQRQTPSNKNVPNKGLRVQFRFYQTNTPNYRNIIQNRNNNLYIKGGILD